MDDANTSKTAASRPSPPTRDRLDTTAKLVGITGGLISAVVLIISLNANTKQRATELRWEQARVAAQLQDDMLINDPQAFNALRMTDWSAFDFIIEGEKATVTREEVHQALDVRNNNALSPTGVFVRESFDRLFYHMGKLERALRSRLIRFEDVCSPMDYYVPFLRVTHRQVLIPYMAQLHHDDALMFIERFDATPKCQSDSPATRS